jgi:hypothetical protein
MISSKNHNLGTKSANNHSKIKTGLQFQNSAIKRDLLLCNLHVVVYSVIQS